VSTGLASRCADVVIARTQTLSVLAVAVLVGLGGCGGGAGGAAAGAGPSAASLDARAMDAAIAAEGLVEDCASHAATLGFDGCAAAPALLASAGREHLSGLPGGLTLGSGVGQVQVSAGGSGYRIVARSRSGNSFTISARAPAAAVLACTAVNTAGACRGGRWG
jgi:hypothetical protein